MLLAADTRTLLNRYSDLLCAYGSALLVQDGVMDVPGGASALPLWEALVKASPHQPSQFITALLSKDHGKLLAYYHLVASLPSSKQHFVARSSDRFNALYKAFPFSKRQALRNHSFCRRDAGFEDLLRHMPLDREGHLDPPGGLDAWMDSRTSLRSS